VAGTATNYGITKIRAGSVGQLWVGCAIPAGSARMTLASDGTPDATANPNAKHLGMTREGATFNVKPGFENFMADEFSSPVKTRMTGLEMTIAAEILQVEDWDILEQITAGFGTRVTDTTFDQLTFGIGSQSYTSVALIFPTEGDKTKYAVFQLYKAFNEAGLDSLQISRKTMSGARVTFRGLDITSRDITDLSGSFWKQK
jgi:hypothetical protein